MRKLFSLFLMLIIGVQVLRAQHANVVWNTPSRNSSESMPCGGGDIGLNVWVENGDLLFYISRSGTFDEHNCQLKQGRVRMRLTPNPFAVKDGFRQELKLNDGYVEVACGGAVVQLWVDVFKPLIHVELKSNTPVTADVFYENWRYQDRLIRKGEGQQNSYKWVMREGMATTKDSIRAVRNEVVFYHRNPEQTVFDVAVEQQGMETVKDKMMNPLKNLTFGGKLWGDNLTFVGTQEGVYAGTDYRAWHLRTQKPVRTQQLHIALHTLQTAHVNEWEQGLAELAKSRKQAMLQQDKKNTRDWWNRFWQRSFIVAANPSSTPDLANITRNYTLFRYMLGCNAYGTVPTKFNGGLFTFDPCHVDEKQSFTPDYRKWGGGTMTAQNQRLVYWPMLKSGDADMMPSQFNFYLRMLGNAELRSKVYWNHAGACFAEQIENFGLPNPAEYGFKRPLISIREWNITLGWSMNGTRCWSSVR